MSTLRDRISGNGLYLLSQIVRKTCRYQVSGFSRFEEAVTSGRPSVFVAWHGMTMMLAGFFSTHYAVSRLVLLMPDDWRGGALGVFAQRLGAIPFPVNLDEKEDGVVDMSAARKVATLVRQVREGHDCYITPDGPDGPAYVVKPGVAYFAVKAKANLLPVGAYARNAYHLNRWDQYTIPYPFSRISIHVGEPMIYDESARDLDTITLPLTDTLHRVAAQATANYYEDAP